MGALNSVPMWSILGAVGVSVPIIIHLLYRKHRRQTDWAAMELLRRALVVRSGQVRLEDYLILAMRCLALALIAAALLRPTLKSGTLEWLGEKRVGMVVAIDGSYSMQHGEPSRFERAIEKAAKILESAEPGEPVTLVVMSNRPQVLTRRAGYDQDVFEKLLDEQKQATPYPLNLELNLDKLAELVEELKTPGRECYLITDSQEVDWGELSEGAEGTLERIGTMANVITVPVEIENEDNLSLTDLRYDSGSLQKLRKTTFIAEVRNNGRRTTDGGAVEFSVGDDSETGWARTERVAVGTLEPGKTGLVSQTFVFDQTGDVRLRAQLVQDSKARKDYLKVDNQRFAVVNVRPSIRMLCVDDESASESVDGYSGSFFTERALRLKFRDSDAPLRVDRVVAQDLSRETLSDFDIIVLTNVSDLGPELIGRIDAFVRRGGGLIVFLGDRVDAKLYNKRFGDAAPGLLPGVLGKSLAYDDDGVGWSLAPIGSGHSLARVANLLTPDEIDWVRIGKVIQVEPSEGTETVFSITEQNAPLLLSRDVGEGSVLMFTTSADMSWSPLAVHPLYPMLLQQAATNMTSHPDQRKVTVGEPVELKVGDRKIGGVVKLSLPNRETTDVEITQSDDRAVCAIDTNVAGVYEIAAGDGVEAKAVAANVNAAESNVRIVDAGAMATALKSSGVKVVTQADGLADAIEESRQGRELAGFLLALGIIVFVLQSLLARYFTNRMSRADTDVSATLQMSRVAAARRS